MSTPGRHVYPSRKGGWAVRKTGAVRAMRIFETRQEAQRFARQLAKKAHTDLFVHRGDGTIEHFVSYSSEAVTPKD